MRRPLALLALAAVLGVAVVSMVSAQSSPLSYPGASLTCTNATSGDGWSALAVKVGAPSGIALANQEGGNLSTPVFLGQRVCYAPSPVPTTSSTIAPTTSTTTSTTSTTVAPTSSTTTTTTVAPPVGDWAFAHRRYEIPANSDAPSTGTVTDGVATIVNHDQNYGDATLRAAVKYDLTAGGTVSLDISDDSGGNPLIGDAYIMFTANPDDAKAQMQSERAEPYAPADMPADALTVRLVDNCRVPWAPPVAVRYANGGRTTNRGTCGATPDGTLRLVFTPGQLSIRNGANQQIVAYPVSAPPTGWVVLGVHNHASNKYGSVPAVTGRFGNVTYPTSSTPAPSAPAATIAPTTTVAPTTQPPAAGVQFVEDFSTDARDRFDWRLQTTVEPPTGDFLGEHDTSTPCGSPTTYRTVRQVPLQWGIPHTNVDVTDSELIWWCAPGNDVARGHMMTALDTGSVATLSFSPKQTFTDVRKVCWDQNMNNLGEGKWINVYVVPAAHVAANGGDLAYADGIGIPFGGVPMRLPPGAFDFDWIRGSINAHKIDAAGNYVKVLDRWKSYSPGGIATESASRFTICLDSGANRVTLERPDGTTDTYPMGASFPAGEVRVIWQDASYNPTKHEGSEHSLTWHFDQIEVS
jgi:hypothetical protein